MFAIETSHFTLWLYDILNAPSKAKDGRKRNRNKKEWTKKEAGKRFFGAISLKTPYGRQFIFEQSNVFLSLLQYSNPSQAHTHAIHDRERVMCPLSSNINCASNSFVSRCLLIHWQQRSRWTANLKRFSVAFFHCSWRHRIHACVYFVIRVIWVSDARTCVAHLYTFTYTNTNGTWHFMWCNTRRNH